ncbi:MAG: ComF family protein [Victivallales bacterium]|nr:ComF family protein [Victivallales bacterium]
MLNQLRPLRDFVTPPVCPLCGKELTPGKERLCPDCEQGLPLWPERRCKGCGGANDSYLDLCHNCQQIPGGRPWKIAVSGLPYYGSVREAIHRYKYREKVYFLPFLAGRMADEWLKMAPGVQVDAVTYIPLHWMRHLQRGYNQSEMLAKYLAHRLGVPCIRALRRTRKTSQQAALDQAARLANIRRAFAPVGGETLLGMRLLLVDDVFTTGATLGEATKTLLKAGVSEVSVITAARD